MSKTKKRTTTKKNEPAERRLTAADWFAESARVMGNEDEPDRNDPAELCGAMLLAALQDGSTLHAIAASLEVTADQIAEYHANCVKSGVFLPDGKVSANWFDEKNGGTSFQLDVLVALGLAERAA